MSRCHCRAVLSITMSVNRGQSYAGHSVQWEAPVTCYDNIIYTCDNTFIF